MQNMTTLDYIHFFATSVNLILSIEVREKHACIRRWKSGIAYKNYLRHHLFVKS